MKNIHPPCHPEAASDAARRIPSVLQKPQGILPLRFALHQTVRGFAQGQNDKKRTRMTRAERGFTLVELIVVIVIIGIVAGLVTANLIGARQRARDAQRKSDLRQIQAALELYRADQGSYPTATVNCPTDSPTYFGNPACNVTYMRKVPRDPSSSTYNSGSYYYTSDGTTYTLAACLENANDADQNSTSTSPGGTGTCSSGKYYVLNNP